MGNYIVYKGLLLDERDFGFDPTESPESMAEVIRDYLVDEYGTEDDIPGVEIKGLAFERTDSVVMIDTWPRTNWVDEAGTFSSIVNREFKHLGLPGVTEGCDLVDIASSAYQSRFQDTICDLIRSGEYRKAGDLLHEFDDLQSIGLPGVRPGPCFSRDADDELVDYRETNHGPGRRIFAEIGFNWGQ